MKRRSLCFIIILLAIFCLVGCGGNNKDDDPVVDEVVQDETAVFDTAVELGFKGEFKDWIKNLEKYQENEGREMIFGVMNGDIVFKYLDEEETSEWQYADLDTLFGDQTVKFVVKFDTGVKGVTVKDVEVEEGKTFKEPTKPNYPGHTLEGWYNGTKKWNFSKDQVTANITLTAKWKINQQKLTLELFDKNKIEKTYDYGTKVTPEIPVREGYVFNRWTDNRGKDVVIPAAGLEIKDDLTLKAIWHAELNGFEFEELKDGNFELVDYKGTELDVVVPSKVNEKNVVKITAKAFANKKDITSITIPATIETIEKDTFKDCNVLTKVNAEDVEAFLKINFENENANPVSIAKGLYFNNVLITELVLSDKAEKVSSFALINNEALTKVDFGGTSFFGESVLVGCKNITSLVLRNKTSLISLFNKEENIPAGLVNVTLTFNEADTKTIGEVFLNGTKKELNITLDESWIELREAEFANTTVLSVALPKTIENVATKVFNGCLKLTTVTVDVNNAKYDSRNNSNAIIETATNKLVAATIATVIPADVKVIGAYAFADLDLDKINSEVAGELIVPNNIEMIEEHAFANLTKLTKVVIANNVVEMGKEVFAGCAGIVDITLPFIGNKVDTNETFAYLFKVVPANLTTVKITNMTEIYENAFANLAQITKVELPANLTKIGKNAFNGTSIVTMVLPETVAEIGEGAFRDCRNLTTINIPEALTTIKASTFRNCVALESIVLGKNVKTIEYAAFYGCKALKTVTLNEGLETIGHSAFKQCEKLTEIIIPATVTVVEYAAFAKCPNLVIKVKDKADTTKWNKGWNVDNNKVIYKVK